MEKNSLGQERGTEKSLIVDESSFSFKSINRSSIRFDWMQIAEHPD